MIKDFSSGFARVSVDFFLVLRPREQFFFCGIKGSLSSCRLI